MSVLLGQGDGTFGTAQSVAVGSGPVSVAVGDLNGDGPPDLVTANSRSNDVSVLLGYGDGTFGTAQSFAVSGMPGRSPISVAVADLNGDSDLDLVTINSSSLSNEASDVAVLLGHGDGTFAAAQTFALVGDPPTSMAVADLNGDGYPDLVTIHPKSAEVAVLFGRGDGTFAAMQKIDGGNDPTFVAVADLDWDGHPDLVISNEGLNEVLVLLGRGDGTFAAAQAFTIGRPLSIAVADLNGDGHPDLVTANGDVRVLLARP